MKKAMMSVLMDIAQKEDLVILSGDLGFNLFEEFQKKYPNRFFNMGIAEQNMVSVAAGLAKTGKKVVVYSIIPFLAFRALEQIRNDLCYPNLNVVLVGMGTGYSYGSLGFSHHAVEDVAVMKALPNMTVASPADINELKPLLEQAFSVKGPVYIRLGKSEQELYLPKKVELGKINVVKSGKGKVIFCYGDILEEVINIDATIVSCHTLKPFDYASAKEIVKKHDTVIVVEEHNKIGGLGDIMRELTPIKHFAVNDEYMTVGGEQKYMREKSGILAGIRTI